MANDTEPSDLQEHVAVRLKDCIVVLTEDGIWTYSLWTEKWRTYNIRHTGSSLPTTSHHCGVAFRSDAYMYGGFDFTNMLWKLTRKPNGSFGWSTINMGKDPKRVPSPRTGHCGWEHGGKLWFFGGHGRKPEAFLNDHGDFTNSQFVRNNQLFSYEPSTRTWENVKCSGDVLSPRSAASAAKLKDKVWLHGGIDGSECSTDDLYELDMYSLTWTEIDTGMTKPGCRAFSSLVPIAGSQLVLHGGWALGNSAATDCSLTWILDLHSYSWRKHPVSESYYRQDHSGITGLNNDAIILGGYVKPRNNRSSSTYSTIFSVRLQPKTLQQLAMKIIFVNIATLSLKGLPTQLNHKILGLY